MCRGGGGILVGAVVKSKVGELEKELREIVFRISRNELTGVVQGVSRRKRLFVRFQDGFKKIRPQINSP